MMDADSFAHAFVKYLMEDERDFSRFDPLLTFLATTHIHAVMNGRIVVSRSTKKS